MNKESLFLNIINGTISDNSYLGDDCAYLKDLDLIISQDTLVEGVHFLLNCMNPFEIGKKALIVNISDILAGGGVPKYITVSLSGKLNEGFIKDFYLGIDEICTKYNIKLIGGDLTGGDKVTISICILGDTKNRFISSRKNAKVGDIVYLAGKYGNSAYGLSLLLNGIKDRENKFIKAHIEPVLYPEISDYISKNFKNYTMMDTSDGLYDALNKVSKMSNVGFDITYSKIPKDIDDKNLVLFGGEDFGLLVCLNKKIELDGLFEIGKVTDTLNIVIDNEIISEDKSFNHFK